MAVPSEVRRVQAAIDNRNHKELEWSLWYARMRQSVPSARPADVKYWSAVEQQVEETLHPPAPARTYPTRKKKKEGRGLGISPLPGEAMAQGSADETGGEASAPDQAAADENASSADPAARGGTSPREAVPGSPAAGRPPGRLNKNSGR